MEKVLGELYRICTCEDCGGTFKTRGLVCPSYCNNPICGSEEWEEYEEDDDDGFF
ncbi:MAG: hypothetical protein ACE5F4_02875 [Candidatus Paceibacteria bacterium]